jgi:hypothetical protein
MITCISEVHAVKPIVNYQAMAAAAIALDASLGAAAAVAMAVTAVVCAYRLDAAAGTFRQACHTQTVRDARVQALFADAYNNFWDAPDYHIANVIYMHAELKGRVGHVSRRGPVQRPTFTYDNEGFLLYCIGMINAGFMPCHLHPCQFASNNFTPAPFETDSDGYFPYDGSKVDISVMNSLDRNDGGHTCLLRLHFPRVPNGPAIVLLVGSAKWLEWATTSTSVRHNMVIEVKPLT